MDRKAHLPFYIMSELYNTSILMKRAKPRFEEFEGKRFTGLNVGGRGKILNTLIDNPGISQKDLAQILNIRPQSLGETLIKLEAENLIERETNQKDKRILNIYLTDLGNVEAKKIQKATKRGMAIAFQDMTDDEQETLLCLLEKLNQSIENNVDLFDEPQKIDNEYRVNKKMEKTNG